MRFCGRRSDDLAMRVVIGRRAPAFRTGIGAAIAAALIVSARITADNQRWGAEYFPNVVLTTHQGREVRFYDDLIKDKIVAIDLIYTTCQYNCPLETARLAQVQRVLGDRVGRDIFFYSITIDPDHDTPAVLEEYAEKYHVGPGWLFLTGKASDIELISRKLGLYSEPDPSNLDGHTPMLVVGNERTRQWMRNSALDNPGFLARTIGDWLTSWQSGAKQALRSFAEVPPLNFDEGQYTFKNHCVACHTIGGGDAIGPDLKGVVALRDRRWLARFIATPDRVFADHDPIADDLLARYKQVRMPNLSLTDHDATVLIEYIARESSRPAPSARAPAASVLPSAAGGPKALIDAYLRMQRALAADNVDGVLDGAVALATEAVAAGSRAAPIKVAVNPFAHIDDLGTARAAFGPLSDALITYLRAGGVSLDEDVHAAYCPMARKYWLQQGETIANPYYGRRMAECGRIVAGLPDPAS
jgi:protein SCO1